MSQNPGEHLTKVYDDIALRLQTSIGVVGEDTLNLDIETYYAKCLSEQELPLSSVKFIHDVLQYRYLCEETTPVRQEMLDIPIKVGLGIGLLIGSRIITDDEDRDGLFELFILRMEALSLAPAEIDLSTMLEAEGKTLADELKREASPRALFEPFTNGPSPEHDDFRNRVFTNALGFALGCARSVLELQELLPEDFLTE